MSKDCRDIDVLLSGLIDGEIADDDRHAAERHIASCDRCTATLNEAERLDLSMKAEMAVVDTLPSGFADAVLAQTTRRAASTRRLRLISTGGWLAAAAAIALAFTLWIRDRGVIRELSDTIAWLRDNPAADISGVPALASSTYHLGPEVESVADNQPLPSEIFERIAGSAEVERPDLEATEPLSMDEVEDTLFAADTIIEMLTNATRATFTEDLDYLRRIIEYDELLPRLAGVRHASGLSNEERESIRRIEAVLNRIVNGTIEFADIESLRDSLNLPLSQRINILSRR